MGRLKAILYLLITFAAPEIAIAAAPSELPRMWLASKPGRGPDIYLLGITHLGVPVEYDGYLDSKILPAARRASRFYLEGVSAAREISREPACRQALTDPEAKATEARARAALFELEYESLRSMRDNGIAFVKAPDVQLEAMARSDAEDLSELGLMGAFRIYEKAPEVTAAGARGSVVGPLRALFRPDQVHDIDEPGAFARAYCGMGPSRARYFYEQTLGRGISNLPDSAARLSDTIARLNIDFIETIKQTRVTGTLSSPPEWDRPVVCERNTQWLRKLDSQPARSTLFVAVGIAHLFASGHAGAPCNGLLQDLVDQGYSVHLVD